MLHRIKRGISLALLATGLLSAGMPAPANARPIKPLDSVCDPDWVCMFEDNNYYGDRYDRSGVYENFYDLGWWNGDNEISSVKNRTQFYLCMYAGDSPSGDYVRIPPGQYVPNLGSAYAFDNDAESIKITSGAC
ncbi:MAG: peptidase inhibitor family I36 protein [Hamadaea sp.]|uniref:peptidase inhibitor family I36 protein n=1 Tax=Hamadaea sp. TaxID=2024425 RepID=UPI0017F6B07C|nr:peptidase inhibitor family I36 protein [Hamadaea sp.]NUR70859.1 peptidase inhibitor family I36 protein [Hamadaea sp.]NUT20886.1 peptidase inhibitor family I36 protein [Hamadaea sp.]